MENKYFSISDYEQIIGVIEFTDDNEKANDLIKEAIKDHYCADGCDIVKGFRFQEYKYKPLEITGYYWEGEEEKNDFTLYIEQVTIYK